MDERYCLFSYDFLINQQQIAQEPVFPRDSSRLMVVYPNQSIENKISFEHRSFHEILHLLQPNDVLVVNETKVIQARLFVEASSDPSAKKIELFFIKPLGDFLTSHCWEAMAKPMKKLTVGKVIQTPQGDSFEVLSRQENILIIKSLQRPIAEILEQQGEVPLPPYIKRSYDKITKETKNIQMADATSYQSIFAQKPGAIAAPTASLHFTERLKKQLEAKGLIFVDVLLHVGLGTFLPMRPEHAEDIRQHQMHTETYAISEESQAILTKAKSEGRRIIAVGTTVVRALESWAQSNQPAGESQLFIYPGYRFKVIDGLLTNFHLPKSTLLLLVAALMGKKSLMYLYEVALTTGYRFFSYGDAMLILPDKAKEKEL